MEPAGGLRLPVQSPPVSRGLIARQGHENEDVAGVEAQGPCDNLPYLARQMCLGLLNPPT
jgi:hypothetical protein